MNGLGVSYVDRIAIDPNGNPHRAQYFEHAIDGQTFIQPVDIDSEDHCLLPSLVISICEGVRVSPIFFGFTLD